MTLPVQYAVDGAAVWVMVGRPESKRWWRNFSRGHPARLRIRGRWVDATGTLVRGDESAAETLAGLDVYRRRFPKAGRALGLPAGADPSEKDLAAAAAKAVFVRFETGT